MSNAFDFKLGSAYSLGMRVGWVVAGIVISWVLSASPSLADDQTPPKEAPPKEAPPKEAPKAIQETAPVDIGDVAKMSNEEKEKRVEKALTDERDALKRVTEILAQARSAKDIVQLNCVNEKLTQIKGLLRISEDASSRMYDAIGTGTQDVVNHEFTKIAVAHQKTLVIRSEAEQCVGELSVYTGETEITVEVPPGEENPTAPTPPPPGPEVPPFGSRF